MIVEEKISNNTSKIYIFLSSSNEVKSAITCRNCNANIIVNALEMPMNINLIKDTTDKGAIEKLKTMRHNDTAKIVGIFELSNLIDLWEDKHLLKPVESLKKPIEDLRQKQDVYNEILGELKKVGDIMFTETTEKDIWDLVYNKLTNKEERSIESLEE